MAGGFEANTRLKTLPGVTISRPVGGGTSAPYQLPRTGLLRAVRLAISGTVSGTVSAPNALGFASIVSNVRLTLNSGIDVFNISGAGFHYLLRQNLELGQDVTPQSNATSAVTATAFNLDMHIPVAINLRDPLGLLMLQSEQTTATLYITWLADASVATGATVTATATAYLEVFTVPTDRADWPTQGMAVIHQILEDQQQVSGAGLFTYSLPRGNRYLGVLHGFGIGAAPADNWTTYNLRVNQSDYIDVWDPTYLNMVGPYESSSSLARPKGQIPVNFMQTSGLGDYDKFRDTIDSALVTQLDSVINATGAGTLYTVRRQLVALA